MNRVSACWFGVARCTALAAAVPLAALAGCGKAPTPHFSLNLQGQDPASFYESMAPNESAAKQAKFRDEALRAITNSLTAMFGTPDEPFVMPETGLDLKKLQLAAGPVGRDTAGMTRGLYRQHCVHCHGITGDGAGPTALFLDPFPRDYRQGKFKFKSTQRTAKPTDADLKRVILEGVPGTAMPSFLLLPNDEVDALVEYVKYLSIRGETELLLDLTWLVNEEDIDTSTDFLVQGMLMPVVNEWQKANQMVLVPADRPPVDTPEKLAASIAAGRELYLGGRAQCGKCHGPTGLGDGSDEDLYDDWNKDKTAAHASWWLLPKQQLQPRNLRLGIYRGGRRPADLYRRIYAGVNGTPMPNAGLDPANPQGLKPEEVWQIVDYVRSLPYDPMSDPAEYELKVAQHAQF